MAIANGSGYKAFMRRISTPNHRSGALGRAAVLLIPLIAAGACNEDDDPFLGQAGAGGEHSAGASGHAGASGDSGEGGTTPSEGGVGAGGHAGAFAGPIAGEPCSDDEDCDDGLYCNGKESCIDKTPGSQAKICWSPEQGPCANRSCDERTEACDCSNPDEDGDGATIEGCTPEGKPFDCDDTDSKRRPGRAEVCDADDRDEDCNDQTYGQRDKDDDGFYDDACANFSATYGYRIGGTDCDDENLNFNPLAREKCDGLDNDCDGVPDDVNDFAPGEVSTFYPDVDGDLYGDPDGDPLTTPCSAPFGYVKNDIDCDDTTGEINPGREEICNGVDDDCDSKIDLPRAPGTLMFDEPYDGGRTKFVCQGVPGWAVSQCAAGRLNCGDQSYRDGCETIGTTLCNCHACGNTCSFSCGESACEDIVSISTGGNHTCALLTEAATGTSSVACWGRNNEGQLGSLDYRDSFVPVKVQELRGVKAVAAGGSHSCAVAAPNDTLYCWGSDAFGQLGSLRTETSSSEVAGLRATVSYPVLVNPLAGTLTNVRQVSTSQSHTCAIYDGGKLACWGLGSNGQLGDDTVIVGTVHTQERPVPVRRTRGEVQSFVENATQVVTGMKHSCALLESGAVECWGDDSMGQLANPVSDASRGTAGLVLGLPLIDELAAGPYHTCARSGGKVYCWGNNSMGELARPRPDEDAEEFQDLGVVEILGVAGTRTIIAGGYFGCAVSEDDVLSCWGGNDQGQRGCNQDAENPAITPTVVGVDKKHVFSGSGAHLCSVDASGRVECWGENRHGQLGDGTASLQPECRSRSVLPLGGAQECLR